MVIYQNSQDGRMEQLSISTQRGARKGGSEMEEELFEKLLESIREAGAILRGEQEPARLTHLNEADGELHAAVKAQDIK